MIKKGVKPIQIVYADGGQNEHFRHAVIADVSDPDALAAGPTEIELDEQGKPIPAVVKVAAADAVRASTTSAKPAADASQAAKAQAVAPQAAAPQAPAPATQTAASSGSPFSAVAGVADSGGSMVKKWFTFGSSESASSDVKVYEPAEPIPTDVPLPPRRNAASAATGTGSKPQASLPAPRHLAGASPSPLIAVAAAMQAQKQ